MKLLSDKKKNGKSKLAKIKKISEKKKERFIKNIIIDFSIKKKKILSIYNRLDY